VLLGTYSDERLAHTDADKQPPPDTAERTCVLANVFTDCIADAVRLSWYRWVA